MKSSSSFTNVFSIFILIPFLILQSNAQPAMIPSALKGKQPLHLEKVNAKSGEITQRITRRDGTSKDIVIDLTEQLSLIIELKDEPLFIQQLHSTGPLMKKVDPRVHLNQFRSDVTSLHQSLMARTKLHFTPPVIVPRILKSVFRHCSKGSTGHAQSNCSVELCKKGPS